MPKPVRFQEMLGDLRRSLGTIPEHRRGQNIQYEIEDTGLAAFSVFYLLLAAELFDQPLARLNDAGICATKRGPEGPLSWVANGVIRPDLPSRG